MRPVSSREINVKLFMIFEKNDLIICCKVDIILSSMLNLREFIFIL